MPFKVSVNCCLQLINYLYYQRLTFTMLFSALLLYVRIESSLIKRSLSTVRVCGDTHTRTLACSAQCVMYVGAC